MRMDRKAWTAPDLAIEWTDLFYFLLFIYFIFGLDCFKSVLSQRVESPTPNLDDFHSVQLI